MSEPDTKHKILDAAEQLFAQEGFAATSLRAITAAAGVNLAAVNYHFGSKDDLVRQVFRRRMDPINRERLELLAEAEQGTAPPTLDSLIHAFLAPPLRQMAEPARAEIVWRLHGRLHEDPNERWSAMFWELFRPVAERFLDAFARALPHLGRGELVWRMHFLVGVLVHTMSHGNRVNRFMGGTEGPPEPAQAEALITAFVRAGLEAPPADLGEVPRAC